MDAYVIDNDKRREIARFIRQIASKGFEFEKYNITSAMDIDWEYAPDRQCWNRLAELIDPDPMTINDVYWWTFANMESCDEPEWTLFNEIEAAILKYRDAIKERNDGQLDEHQ